MLNKICIYTLTFIMAASFSNANESAGEKPAHEKSGGEPPAQGPQKLPEWSDMINKLAALNAKIKQKEEVIKKLIIDKQHASGEKSKDLVESLIRENKELNQMKEQYEKQRMVLKYRFPEKLLKEGRTYDRKKIMTLQETEKQVGLDGKLDQSLKKIRSKYPNGETSEEAKSQVPVKEKHSESESDFDQSKPIVIQK